MVPRDRTARHRLAALPQHVAGHAAETRRRVSGCTFAGMQKPMTPLRAIGWPDAATIAHRQWHAL
ncbi:MAG: hypothetical protein ABIP11_00640, partial [Luteimonas sp.]